MILIRLRDLILNVFTYSHITTTSRLYKHFNQMSISVTRAIIKTFIVFAIRFWFFLFYCTVTYHLLKLFRSYLLLWLLSWINHFYLIKIRFFSQFLLEFKEFNGFKRILINLIKEYFHIDCLNWDNVCVNCLDHMLKNMKWLWALIFLI